MLLGVNSPVSEATVDVGVTVASYLTLHTVAAFPGILGKVPDNRMSKHIKMLRNTLHRFHHS